MQAVRELSENGPKLVIDFLINHTGTKFDRNDAGELDYTEEAAHSQRRIVHYQDFTGEEIQRSLIEYAEKKK